MLRSSLGRYAALVRRWQWQYGETDGGEPGRAAPRLQWAYAPGCSAGGAMNADPGSRCLDHRPTPHARTDHDDVRHWHDHL
jgi:hypothetical protein